MMHAKQQIPIYSLWFDPIRARSQDLHIRGEHANHYTTDAGITKNFYFEETNNAHIHKYNEVILWPNRSIKYKHDQGIVLFNVIYQYLVQNRWKCLRASYIPVFMPFVFSTILLDQGSGGSNARTTNVMSSNPTQGEMYSIQHYVIKFSSELRQVGGFRRVL